MGEPVEHESIRILARPGHTVSEAVEFRIAPQHADTLLSALDEAGVQYGEAVEFSVQEEVLRIFVLTGPPGAIWLGLKAFWHRNDGKRVEIVDGSITIEGSSEKKVLEMLERMDERQRANEAAFQEMLSRMDNDD